MKFVNACSFLAGMLVLGVGAAPSQAAVDSATASQIESALEALVSEHAIVGLQVAIGMDGVVAWTGAYGLADAEHDIPVNDSTLFRTASVSKWMTATAAMRLVESNRLDLDAPVQQHCPEYPDKKWTLSSRHLLSHRGGVRHYWGANGEAPETLELQQQLVGRRAQERLWMSVRYTDVVDPVGRFKNDPLLFEPGTDFRYTSNGYRLLGCVLRGAGGKSYTELMQETVFGPARMSHTLNDDAYAIIPGRARGYTLDAAGGVIRSRFRDVSENLPAGGHLSTASDLVRFAMAWHAGLLVGKASMDAMTALPANVAASDRYYGFGVGVRSVEGERFFSHGGSQDGARSFLILNADTGRTFAWMTNYERIPRNFEVLITQALLAQLD